MVREGKRQRLVLQMKSKKKESLTEEYNRIRACPEESRCVGTWNRPA